MPQRSLKLKRLVYKFLYGWLGNKADGFVAVSDEVHEAIVKQINSVRHKVYTITNGVDTRRYEQPGNKAALCQELNLKLDSYLIATIGRLTTQKGHCYLIEAAAEVVAAYPNTHFLLIGEGELRESLELQIQQANLTSSVHFLGRRKDIPNLLGAIDLFVLPSLWEGLSIALLEAMAAAKPIVATKVAGTNQVMVQGKTGLLVAPGDSHALATAILEVLANPNQAKSLGVAARFRVINNYSAQHQTNEHLTLYRRLLNST
jgi:glycosyltransferase involved in cell wall biosynthesis